MQKSEYTFGFWSALVPFVAAVGYSVTQILQVVGVLVFPWDGILKVPSECRPTSKSLHYAQPSVIAL